MDTGIVESESSESDGIAHLSKYFAICRRRLWLIIGFTLAFGSLTAFWSLTKTSIYQTTAGMVFEPPVPQVIRAEVEQGYRVAFDQEQFQTHVQLLTSYPILKETIDRLTDSGHLEHPPTPPFLRTIVKSLWPHWINDIRDWLKGMMGRIREILIEELTNATLIEEAEESTKEDFPGQAELALVNGFSSQVLVEHVQGSKLVNITVVSVDPIFAAHAANTLATVYIDRFHNAQTQATQSSADWYAGHINSMRQKVEESEKALYAYRSKHALVDVNDRQSTAEQKLARVNLDLINAEAKRTEVESRFRQIEKIWQKVISRNKAQTLETEDINKLINFFDSSAVKEFRSRQIKLSVELAKLSENYGPLHPKMIKANTELKSVENGIGNEIRKSYESVRNEYHLALENERASRDRFEQQKAKKLRLDKFVAEYSILEREADSHRQLFDAYLDQMKKTDLATEAKASNMYLAKSALPNLIPIEPRPIRSSLLGFIFGLISGVGLAFFLEFYDRRLKSPQDLDHYSNSMGYPVIGWVPRIAKSSQQNSIPVLESDPLSMAADCYRRIRTSVWLSCQHEEALSLAITSPGEQEGKTTLAVNLSIAMSQLEGNQVVLIDADLRRPSVHKFFDMGNGKPEGKGLADYLTGHAKTHEIFHQTRIPNVMMIPSGKMVRNHTELLHSEQLSTLLRWCKQRGYHVIIDTPPVLALVDSLVIANQVLGTILVVSAGETDRDATKMALQQISGHGGKVLGVVMQKVPQDRVGYGLNVYWKSSYHTPSLFSGGNGKRLLGKSESIKTN